MTIPVDEKVLESLAHFADFTRVSALNLWGKANARNQPEAGELMQMHMDAAAALVLLRENGAPMSDGLPTPEPVPLHQLDTPANRRLCRALREAFEAAVEVDRERGFTDEDPEDGPSALPIAELLVKVEQEVYGPSGKGEGAER